VVWRNNLILKINYIFTYNTVLFIKQEKNCNSTPKKLISGGMKVAVNIRMPKAMKKALDQIAANEFRSLNSVILQFLDEQLNLKAIDWRKEGKNPKK